MEYVRFIVRRVTGLEGQRAARLSREKHTKLRHTVTHAGQEIEQKKRGTRKRRRDSEASGDVANGMPESRHPVGG